MAHFIGGMEFLMCSIVNEFVERAMTLFNIYFIINRLVRAIVTSAIKNIRKK